MVYLDNPAGRIQFRLEKVRALPGNTKPVEAWAEVFSISPIEVRHVVREGVRLMDQAAEARRKIEALADQDPHVVLRNFHEVETTVARFAHITAIGTIEDFLNSLSPSGLHAAELCSSILHRRSPEPFVAVEQRQRLIENVDALIAEVNAADDLDREVRGFVVEHLARIRDAIRNSPYNGTEPIRREVDEFLGTLVSKRTFWQRLTEDKVLAVVTLLAIVDSILSIGASTLQLMAREESKVIVNVYNTATGCNVPEPKEPGLRVVPVHGGGDVQEAEIVGDDARPAGG
ncbi:hypothetical protein [Kribbella karoonensis]|uniref:PhoU domain-containing protein n=1 Tax=Kribbella karoonensis TaxID=324851 RepID=A0ABP4PPA4_9ACTN